MYAKHWINNPSHLHNYVSNKSYILWQSLPLIIGAKRPFLSAILWFSSITIADISSRVFPLRLSTSALTEDTFSKFSWVSWKPVTPMRASIALYIKHKEALIMICYSWWIQLVTVHIMRSYIYCFFNIHFICLFLNLQVAPLFVHPWLSIFPLSYSGHQIQLSVHLVLLFSSYKLSFSHVIYLHIVWIHHLVEPVHPSIA